MTRTIYLIPPVHVMIYGKHYEEGVYGNADFTPEQMQTLVDLGCATWFDISSPHTSDGSALTNARPSDYIGPVYTTLQRAEIWGLDWFPSDMREEIAAEYAKYRGVFQRQGK